MTFTKMAAMNQARIDKYAQAIADNMNIDSAIYEAMDSFFSGIELDPEDEQAVTYSVRYALAKQLTGETK